MKEKRNTFDNDTIVANTDLCQPMKDFDYNAWGLAECETVMEMIGNKMKKQLSDIVSAKQNDGLSLDGSLEQLHAGYIDLTVFRADSEIDKFID